MRADPGAPLGVFDSGVGGLTVLNALQRALPHEDFIYLGDTARVPYGSKPPEMIRAFALEISKHLVARGVKGIVVACNTASATSLPDLQGAVPRPVWGVIQPGVRAAVEVAGGKRVGVLGTQATVRSGAYQAGLERQGLDSWAKACPLFVPIVEEGVSDGEIARLVARHYLAERPELAAVILGCTHYPALKNILQEVLGPSVRLVDTAEETAKDVATSLSQTGLAAERSRAGRIHHLVTGDLDSYLHTARVIGGPVGTAERVPLPLLAHEPATAGG